MRRTARPTEAELAERVAAARKLCRGAGIPVAQVKAIEELARAVWREEDAAMKYAVLYPVRK